jgi:hypothetical protein
MPECFALACVCKTYSAPDPRHLHPQSRKTLDPFNRLPKEHVAFEPDYSNNRTSKIPSPGGVSDGARSGTGARREARWFFRTEG